jgi:hypothetical protein
MPAQPVLYSLNALYLALMAVVSLAGTTALLKLIASLVKPERHERLFPAIESEDA